tara:strand:- start:292 stop:462 length:171 start_codon:yes stop_codon:yes gene_type:complete
VEQETLPQQVPHKVILVEIKIQVLPMHQQQLVEVEPVEQVQLTLLQDNEVEQVDQV